MTAEEKEKLEDEKEFISCRRVLYIVVFLGFAINSVFENNVSLTIIGMVVPEKKAAIDAQCKLHEQTTSNFSNLWTNQSSESNIIENNFTRIDNSSLDHITSYENITPVIPMEYSDRFAWTPYEQSLVLGSYFWVHWLTHLPGGFLSHRYGTKAVFGLSNLLTALLGFLTPFCVHFHLYAFVALRILQGITSGFAWPSMHNMTAKWIPLTERSKFVTSYLGSSMGTALSFPLCALLINWHGWEAVFYVTSTLGVIWCIAWYYLVFNTPQKHPRITKSEKKYILENLENSVSHSIIPSVPWKDILTSRPIWLVSLATGGASWAIFTINIEAPSYFNYVHGWNINTTSLLSATPLVLRVIFSYVFSSLADWGLKTKRISTTRMRKVAMTLCNGMQCAMLLSLAYSGCHPMLAIALIIMATVSTGTLAAGSVSACIDICPNYASVAFGICNSASAAAAFIAPTVVGLLINNNRAIEQWRLVFLIAAAVPVLALIPFLIFAESKPQAWNFVEDKTKCDTDELQKLQPNPDDAKLMELQNNTSITDKDRHGTQVDV